MTRPAVLTPGRFVEQVVDAARRHGVDPKPVALTCTAAAVCLLGVPAGERRVIMARLAAPDVALPAVLNALWAAEVVLFPYLGGHLWPLTGWLDAPEPSQVDAARAVFGVLAAADLSRLVEDPQVRGDLLGMLYSALMAPADRSARGAFYTPPGVGALMAEMNLPRNRSTFYDPCSGSGGLAVAAIRAMRRAGRTPETVTWCLADIDALAVALAGVNLAAHGMPSAILACQDSMTQPVLRSAAV